MWLKYSRPLFVVITFLLFSQAQARWAKFDEANIECLHNTLIYRVKKDGSFTMELEIHLKALTEAGRHALSTQAYIYDATLSSLEVLEAKTKNGDTVIVVPKEKIEDKPLASDPRILTENHQVLIPIECVNIGSIIQIKMKRHIFKPQLENYFAASLTFDQNLWKHTKVIFESELPLVFKVNDPRACLDFKQYQTDRQHRLEINLKKPTFEVLCQESEHSYREPAHCTSINVSTEKDYTKIGKLLAKMYQGISSEQLPQGLEVIKGLAGKENNEIDCMDTAVTLLIDKLTYLSSCNTFEGHYAPRSLEAIIKSGYGDCKEYSTCLAALLNKLGYTAKIAFVNRGGVYLPDEDRLPSLEHFNHVIVKVISPSGKTYWIDPTNIVSMAEGIFPDIANTPAFILDTEHPTYEHVPEINYQHAIARQERVITLQDDKPVSIEGTVRLEGEEAQELIEFLKRNPVSIVKDALIKSLCESTDPINPNINLPIYSSRKVRPIEGSFSYGDHHFITLTNAGKACSFSGSWYIPYVCSSHTDDGALYVGYPHTIIKKTIFKNVAAQGLERLAFDIRTPWLNAKRELAVTNEGVVVTETIEKLKSLISSKDLKSEKFTELKKTLRKYCNGVSIIFMDKKI